MKYIFLSTGLFVACATFGQQTVDVSKTDVKLGQNAFYTVAGEPFSNLKFVKLTDGTPYFKDSWLKATAIGENGYEFKNLTIKLNLFDNDIIFLQNGNEFIATTPVKKIVLSDSTTGQQFAFSKFDVPIRSGKNMAVWYESLAEGKASLYKEYKKIMSETQQFGSATTDQKIITREIYLIYINNVFLEAKKLKDIPSILAGKKKELEDYLKNKDDEKASMDDRFRSIIDYYNSLVKDSK